MLLHCSASHARKSTVVTASNLVDADASARSERMHDDDIFFKVTEFSIE